MAVQNNPGLVIDLQNYDAFDKELKQLDKTLAAIDKRIGRAGAAFEALEKLVGKDSLTRAITDFAESAEKSTDSLDKNAKALKSFADAAKMAQPAVKVIQDLAAAMIDLWSVKAKTGGGSFAEMVDGINEAMGKIQLLGKDEVTTLKAIRSLSRAVKEMVDIGNQIGGGGFQYFFSLQPAKMRNVLLLMEGISEAVSKLDSIRRPANQKAAAAALGAIASFLNEAKKLQADLKGGAGGIFTKSSNLFKITRNLVPVMQEVSNALQTLDQIRSPSTTNAVAGVLDSIVSLIETLNRYAPQLEGGAGRSGILAKLFGRGKTSELFKSVRNLAPILKEMSAAMETFGDIKRPAAVQVVGNVLQDLSKFIQFMLQFASEMPALVEKAGIFGRALKAGQALKALPIIGQYVSEALAAFSKIKSPENVNSIAAALDALAKLLPRLNEVSGNKNFGKEIKNNIGKGLIALAKDLATAASKVPDPAKLSAFAESLRKLGLAMQNLQRASGFAENSKAIAEGIREIVDGMQKGFKGLDGEESMMKQGQSWGLGFLKGFKKVLGIASPSKVMMELASWVYDGFKGGLNSSTFAALGSTVAKGFAENFIQSFAINYIVDKVLDGFDSLRNAIGNRMRQLGADMRRFGQDMMQTGFANLSAGGITGFVQSQGVQMVAEVGQIMKEIEIFGALTREELALTEAAILDFSAVTKFAPAESAQAFLGLQKAGLDTAEAMKSLPQIGNLAAASNTDLNTSTNAVIRTMQAFGLTIDDTTRITDAYVQAANASTAEVTGLIAGMEDVAPIAANFGMSMEETIAVLALFSDAGITGAEAGNQLRSMLTGLTRPSKEVTATFKELGVSLTDAQGNFKPLNEIVNDLNESMNSVKTVTSTVMTPLSAEQKNLLEEAEKAWTRSNRTLELNAVGLQDSSDKAISNATAIRNNAEAIMGEILGSQEVVGSFTQEITRSQAENFRAIQALAGSFGQTGLSILLGQDEDAINEFIETMGGLPDAYTIATEIQDTFKGSLDSLIGSFDALRYKALNPLLETIGKDFNNAMIVVINTIAELDPTILKTVAVLGILGSAFMTLLGIGQIVVGLIALNLAPAFTLAGTAAAAMAAIIFNPFGVVFGLISIATHAAIVIPLFGALALAAAGLGAMMYTVFHDIQNNVGGAGDEFKRLLENVSSAVTELWGILSNGAQIIVNIATGFYDTETSLLGVSTSVDSASSGVANFLGFIADGVGTIKDFLTQLNGVLSVMNQVGAYSRGEFAQTESAFGFSETLKTEREALVAELEALGADTQNAAADYLVKSGDNLTKIVRDLKAQGIETTVEEIAALNELTNPNMIIAGQTLKIPGLDNQAVTDLQNQIASIDQQMEEQLWDSANNPAQATTEEFSKMQRLIEQMAQTPLFKNIFGEYSPDDIEGIVDRVGELERHLSKSTGYVRRIANSFRYIFGGQVKRGLDDMALGFGGLVSQVLTLANVAGGLNIEQGLIDAFKNADFDALKGYAAEAFGDLVGFAITKGFELASLPQEILTNFFTDLFAAREAPDGTQMQPMIQEMLGNLADGIRENKPLIVSVLKDLLIGGLIGLALLPLGLPGGAALLGGTLIASLFKTGDNLNAPIISELSDIASLVANAFVSAFENTLDVLSGDQSAAEAIADFLGDILGDDVSAEDLQAALNPLEESFNSLNESLSALKGTFADIGTQLFGENPLEKLTTMLQGVKDAIPIGVGIFFTIILPAIVDGIVYVVDEFNKAVQRVSPDMIESAKGFFADVADMIERIKQDIGEDPDELKNIAAGLALVIAPIAGFVAAAGAVATAGAIAATMGTITAGLVALRFVTAGGLEGAIEVLSGLGQFIIGVSEMDGDKVGDGLVSIAAGLAEIGAALLSATLDTAADISEFILNLLGADYNPEVIQGVRDLADALKEYDFKQNLVDGLEAFAGAFDLLNIILDHAILDVKEKLLELQVSVANGLNSIIDTFNELAPDELGLDVDKIDVSGLQDKIDDIQLERQELALNLPIKAVIDFDASVSELESGITRQNADAVYEFAKEQLEKEGLSQREQDVFTFMLDTAVQLRPVKMTEELDPRIEAAPQITVPAIEVEAETVEVIAPSDPGEVMINDKPAADYFTDMATAVAQLSGENIPDEMKVDIGQVSASIGDVLPALSEAGFSNEEIRATLEEWALPEKVATEITNIFSAEGAAGLAKVDLASLIALDEVAAQAESGMVENETLSNAIKTMFEAGVSEEQISSSLQEIGFAENISDALAIAADNIEKINIDDLFHFTGYDPNELEEAIRLDIDPDTFAQLEEIYAAGQNAALGFAEGLGDEGAKNTAVSNMQNSAQAVIDGVKSFLVMQSPSVVMSDLGKNASLGFAQGLNSEETLAAVNTAALLFAQNYQLAIMTAFGVAEDGTSLMGTQVATAFFGSINNAMLTNTTAIETYVMTVQQHLTRGRSAFEDMSRGTTSALTVMTGAVTALTGVMIARLNDLSAAADRVKLAMTSAVSAIEAFNAAGGKDAFTLAANAGFNPPPSKAGYAYGGSVTEGQMVRVNEPNAAAQSRNRSEMYITRSGEQYLLAGEPGYVQPLKDMSGSMGGYTFAPQYNINIDARGSTITEAQMREAVARGISDANGNMSFEKRMIMRGKR